MAIGESGGYQDNERVLMSPINWGWIAGEMSDSSVDIDWREDRSELAILSDPETGLTIGG
jgi:hypothetical protein